MNATENKVIVCDDNAVESWRQFCIEHGYELNDIHARRAFGVGYLAGCVWASEAAMQAAKAVIMGEAALTTKDAMNNPIANMRQEIARLKEVNADLLAACDLFVLIEGRARKFCTYCNQQDCGNGCPLTRARLAIVKATQ
jgi:hypothetical protein